MKVTIHNFDGKEPAAIAACLQRAERFYGRALDTLDVNMEITCFARQPSGWLEYAIKLPYVDTVTNGEHPCRPLFVACIQREPVATFEFHS